MDQSSTGSTTDATTRPVAPPPVMTTTLTQPFWDHAQEGRLAIQRCSGCGSYIHPPRPVCRRCGSFDLAFEPVSGEGTVFTFTETRRAFHPFFAQRVPFILATVELVEQPRLLLLTHLRGLAAADVRFGMPVRVDFEELTPELTIPVFRAAGVTA